MEHIIYSNFDPEVGDEFWLDDERENLDIQLENPILIIADLGFWNGRRQGYKIIESGNIKDILYDDCCNYVKWYSDGYNVKAVATHHDGTNYYEYREIRDRDKIENLLEQIYYGKQITRSKLNYYTRSIHPYIADVYGWQH